MNLAAIKKEVIEICQEVGEFIHVESANFDLDRVEQKGSFNNLVSYVDKEAEKKLVAACQKVLPAAGFITEEGTVKQTVDSEYNWIIDPLDGTSNFLHAPMTRGRLTPERCTPWQFVRPGATAADSAPAGAGRTQRTSRATARVSKIVVQPDGVQVDPDVDARCATWQRRNPGRSVWVTVNREAIRECTGPNGKPTVAQFCAFAELADGRRVMTLSSEKVTYCGDLFQAWSEERIS
jgi:hypothetical protein